MVRPVLAATTVLAVLGSAQAQETYKIGLVAPLTGPFTSTGKQVAAGAQFYLQQNGNAVAGKRIELPSRMMPASRIKRDASCKSSSSTTR